MSDNKLGLTPFLKQRELFEMAEEKRYLVDVGIRDLPFPMRVSSKADPDSHLTVANISISARIMREFEARGIDKFIRVLHQHRDRIGIKHILRMQDEFEHIRCGKSLPGPRSSVRVPAVSFVYSRGRISQRKLGGTG